MFKFETDNNPFISYNKYSFSKLYYFQELKERLPIAANVLITEN